LKKFKKISYTLAKSVVSYPMRLDTGSVKKAGAKTCFFLHKEVEMQAKAAITTKYERKKQSRKEKQSHFKMKYIVVHHLVYMKWSHTGN
jgi:hypothetical protein